MKKLLHIALGTFLLTTVPVFPIPHLEMCQVLSTYLLTAEVPSPETDNLVTSFVCRGTLPARNDIVALGIDLDYVVSGKPLSSLWHTQAAIASSSYASICPAPSTTPPPNAIQLLRATKRASLIKELDHCIARASTSKSLACYMGRPRFSDTPVVVHSTATPTPSLNALLVNGSQHLSGPKALASARTAFVTLPAGGATSSLEAIASDGSKCEIRKLLPPDVVDVQLIPYGKGVSCPSAWTSGFEKDSGCDPSQGESSDLITVPQNYRKLPGTVPASASLSSGCPSGASGITRFESDPARQDIRVYYNLSGCGHTKINIGVSQFGWCNGHAYLNETIRVPIVELTKNIVLQPQSFTSTQELLEWTYAAYFTPRMNKNFLLQGFDWEVRITYDAQKSVLPTREAILVPGAPVWTDKTEKRCFAALFDQSKGGLFVFSTMNHEGCRDSEYKDKFIEILGLGDPCSDRDSSGIPVAPTEADCGSPCQGTDAETTEPGDEKSEKSKNQ